MATGNSVNGGQEFPIFGGLKYPILNPIITGWSNYHQLAISKDIFSKLDV
ncbi:MAG TPA: hypothetical protein C5S51_09475 [Methanosarcinaceae archaeon]|nr:hypothetical protein [Methanosarcinaceae archaeon]